MFDNIGSKIKKLAVIVTCIGIAASVITGLVIMISAVEAFPIGLGVALIGSFLSWLGSFFTYGFGELIESTTYIAKEMGYKNGNVASSNSILNGAIIEENIDKKFKYTASDKQRGYIINKSEPIYSEVVTIPSHYKEMPVIEIGNFMFYNSGLRSITLPNSIKKINTGAFSESKNLKHIYFNGTRAEWNAVEKGDQWDDCCPDYTVHCTDD